jgi:S1-C subfamily serine protease
MTVRTFIRIPALLSVFVCSTLAIAQTPPAPQKPVPPVKVASPAKVPAAPQVVTIVHRLNGLKMFRLLLRSHQQVQTIESLDSAFKLLGDVHTNVIAGLAMDDGETIAAWLPEADVEFGPPAIPAPVAPLASKRKSPRSPAAALPAMGSVFDSPDVTVIGPDGKRLAASYIGLDAATGLSILKLANKKASPAGAINDKPVNTGETVLLLGPEPVTKARSVFNNNLHVRVGAIEGQVQEVVTASSGDVARFKVSAPGLTQANIGGVAINEAGQTIGIVDGLEGTEASILPASQIRRAAERVLEQQASVPRPWLGVKGSAVAALNVNQFLNHGWAMDRASALAEKHRGILLTSIAPGSPAAQAALRAGDVILKVDNKDILNEEDFTWWLEQAGPSSSVEFTVARPDRPAEEELNVKLSGMLNPTFSFNLRNWPASKQGFSLIDQGIEVIALKRSVAMQLGTTAGLLVVYVEPFTAAFDAGLQPGDVIQSINGKPAASFKPTAQSSLLTFEIVRNKEKVVVKLPAKKK